MSPEEHPTERPHGRRRRAASRSPHPPAAQTDAHDDAAPSGRAETPERVRHTHVAPSSSASDWTTTHLAPSPATEDATEPETPALAWEQPAPEISAWFQSPLSSSWLQDASWSYEETEGEDAWSTADSVRRFSVHSSSGSSTLAPTRPALDPRITPDAWLQQDPEPSRLPAEPEPATAAPSTRTVIPRFRRELHGLRAFALLMVAVYHIWLGRVSGGVDVFLFLSAFFLTGTFIRRLDNGRPLAIPRYWLHTFKRLLPPAAVTIALTLVGTALLLPESLWTTVMNQSLASITYWQNYQLVLDAVDYQARDAGAASPLQHFWSLSVQGQVFLIWPLLFLLALPAARRHRHVRRTMGIVVGMVFLASLTWSVYSTSTQQPVAYFDTLTRLWEFAAGSLLAMAMPFIDRFLGARRPEEDYAPQWRIARAVTGWLGIAGLLACGIVLNVSGLFPGWIALWPITAAGLVIIAGHSGTTWGVDRVLSTRLFAFLGDISYALYLVHWPILVFWLHYSSQERAGLLDGLAVLAGSIAVAWVLTRLVDAPIRQSAWMNSSLPRQAFAVAASIALVIGGSAIWRVTLPDTATVDAEGVAVPTAAFDTVLDTTPASLHPRGFELDQQWPDLPYSCEGIFAPESSLSGTRCQTLFPADREVDGIIAIVGSSHARQFAPALQEYATTHNLQVVNLHRDGCRYEFYGSTEEFCAPYYAWATEILDRIQPDVVMTVASTASTSSDELLPRTATALDTLLARGWDVWALRDTPRWETDQFICAETALNAGASPQEVDARCGADLAEKLSPLSPLDGLEGRTGTQAAHSVRTLAAQTQADAETAAPTTDDALPLPSPVIAPEEALAQARLHVIDLSANICPNGRCSPILGDVVVYLDDNHLTLSFVQEALQPVMTARLTQMEGAAG